MSNERASGFSVYRLTILAMLIAVTHVSRLAFAFLPNIQPVTIIIILLTDKFSITDGWIVGVFSILLSNFVLGMGPWTIGQVVSYTVIVLLTAGIKKVINKLPYSFILWVIFSGLTGYIFGLIISIVEAAIFGMAFETFIGYWIAGLPFDTYHAIGNIGFYIILTPTLATLLQRIKKKQ